jgi:protein SCO1
MSERRLTHCGQDRSCFRRIGSHERHCPDIPGTNSRRFLPPAECGASVRGPRVLGTLRPLAKRRLLAKWRFLAALRLLAKRHLLAMLHGGASALQCGLLAVLLAGSFGSPAGAQTPGPPDPARGVGIEPRFGEQVPLDLTFQDHHGRRVRLEDFFGRRPVILHLVYFGCPMLCNMTTDGLIRSLRAFSYDVGDQFIVLTVSFDPREGPALAAAARRSALDRYNREGAESGWHFLTGDEAAIRRLTDAVGYRYRFEPATGQFAHAAGLLVLTPQGRVSRFLGGLEFAPRGLRFAVVEASSGQVGSTVDRAVLLCFAYDPATGRYTLSILRLLKLAGVAFLVASLCGFVWLKRFERRQRRAWQQTQFTNVAG